MDTPQIVGGRIRAIRKRRGLTHKALARRIGRSVNTLSALERGLSKPGLDMLLLLAAALDVPAGDFFAPVAGPAGNPEHAALYVELFDTARTMTLAELDLTVRIAAVVALWRAGTDTGGIAPIPPPIPPGAPASTPSQEVRAEPSDRRVR